MNPALRPLLAAATAAVLALPAGAQRLPPLPEELPAAVAPPALPTPAGAAASGPGAAQPGVRTAALLDGLLTHSRSVLSLREGRLGGPGVARLRALLGASHLVMLGEDHGSAGIADFATALWRELAPLGFAHAAIEADPWLTERLEAELRQGGLAAWTRLAQEQGGAFAPFFVWDAEARFAQAVVADALAAGRPGPALWGLDQLFMGAVPWYLQQLARDAKAAPARRLAAELAQATQGQLMGLTQVPESRWQALHDALEGDAPHRELLAALLLSRRIYMPNTGGPGEVLPANQWREDLMKRSLAAHLARATAKPGGVPPKVMLKFGAYHLYRGASPIQVQGLGGFVSELAVQHGKASLNLLVLCSPGGELLQFDGRRLPCDTSRYGGDWGFIEPYLDPHSYTVFDLRSWRLRPGRVAHLGPGVQRAMGSFDLLVWPPRGSPAAAFLPGVTPPVLQR